MLDNKKIYYSISEVCTQTGLEPHVLRYWESEFPQLRPKKNRAGNRAYRDKDIEVICYIKHLLYKEQFTIPGAKKKIAEAKEFNLPLQAPVTPPEEPSIATTTPVEKPALIKEVVQELHSILRSLKN